MNPKNLKNVPIIVAINKCDKPEANTKKIKTNHSHTK